MNSTLGQIDLNNLDKSDWHTYQFQEIAQKISQTVKPEEAEVDVYVGLEHLDAEDIHIRRRGVPSDVKGGKLRCYPGDIIFGKRRAYQRKAAIVDFKGICSAHAFVFRAIPEVIDPQLFPFFLHSDQFMHRMVDISVGGLSPTINWGDLKHQEFLLPPKDQQARLAELLWAMDEVVEGERGVLGRLSAVKETFIEHFMRQKFRAHSKLERLADICYGMTLNSRRNQLPDQLPYLRVANVLRGRFDLSEVKEIGSSSEEAIKYQLQKGDVLIVEGHADVQQIGRSAVWETEERPMLHQNHLIRVRCGGELEPRFLSAYINSALGRLYFQRNSKSTSGLNTINSTVVKMLKVPIPSSASQHEFTEKKDSLDSLVREAEIKLTASRALQKSLINQIF